MPGSIMPLPVILEEEEDRKIYERLQPPTSMVVRYGFTRMIAELPYKGDAKPGCGSKLIIRTPRGTEIAEMLTSTCPNAGCSKSVTRKQMLEYIEKSGGKDFPFNEKGRVLRVATIDDLNQQAHFDHDKPRLLKFARQAATELDLPMKIVEVEQLIGGERIIFHYTADEWVDFRELVKRLAGEYRTRIEMHQVNAREEARLVADFERCGQHCCCKQFLKVLKPVSMRSAKVQKATLDPTKISGRCGRLMCCLRYEDETYESLRKRLPHRQTIVNTEDGEGVVVDTQILTQLVLVRIEATGKRAAYPLENIEILQRPNEKKKKPKKGKSEGDRDRPQSGYSRGDGQSKSNNDRAQQGEPRRPKPGEPLTDDEVESREGDNAATIDRANIGDDQSKPTGDQPAARAEDGAPAGDAGSAPTKKRRRRRRRGGKRNRGGQNPGGQNPGGQGSNN